MKFVKLKDVCEIIMGQSPPSSSYNDLGEGLPFYQGKTDFGNLFPTPRKYCTEPKRIAKTNDIIMSVRAPVGDVNIIQEDSCIGRGIAALRVDDSLEYKYLFYVLESMKNEISIKGTGSTFKAINKGTLSELCIPVFSREKQIELVRIIEKTRELLGRRQQQIEALSALKQSIFLDVFKENKKYSNVKLRDVITSISAGLSTGGENREKEEGELGVLTTSAVTYGVFDSKAYKVPSEDKIKDKKLVFPTKDSILVSRMNTKKLVGAACLVEEDYTELFIPDRIWRLVPNTELINPYYLISVIQSRLFRTQIDRISTGTSGSMQNISQKNYLDIEIPLLELESQNKYSSKVSSINYNLEVLNKNLGNIKMLYDALLYKAFNGELFKENFKV